MAQVDLALWRGQAEALQAQASDLMRALAVRQPAEGEAGAASVVKARAKTTGVKNAE